MRRERRAILSGQLLDEETVVSLDELCRACRVSTEWVIELVDQGVLEPRGRRPTEWRFTGPSVRQTRVAMSLQRDLGVNLAGAALVLELLSEIDELNARVRLLAES